MRAKPRLYTKFKRAGSWSTWRPLAGCYSGPIPDRSTLILQNGARVTTPSKPPKPKPGERDEPVKIDLDPDVAVRALLQVDPEAEGIGEERDGLA